MAGLLESYSSQPFVDDVQYNTSDVNDMITKFISQKIRIAYNFIFYKN